MSDLTKLIRSIPGGGTVLNDIEAAEGNFAPVVKTAETVAIQHVGTLLSASATTGLQKVLGPAATIAEPLVVSLLDEFEEWFAGKLGITLAPASTSATMAQPQQQAQAFDARGGFLGLRRRDPQTMNPLGFNNADAADQASAADDGGPLLLDEPVAAIADDRAARQSRYIGVGDVPGAPASPAAAPIEYHSAADDPSSTGQTVLRPDEAPDFPSADLTGADDLLSMLLDIDYKAKTQGHSLLAILNSAARSAFGITVV